MFKPNMVIYAKAKTSMHMIVVSRVESTMYSTGSSATRRSLATWKLIDKQHSALRRQQPESFPVSRRDIGAGTVSPKNPDSDDAVLRSTPARGLRLARLRRAYR